MSDRWDKQFYETHLCSWKVLRGCNQTPNQNINHVSTFISCGFKPYVMHLHAVSALQHTCDKHTCTHIGHKCPRAHTLPRQRQTCTACPSCAKCTSLSKSLYSWSINYIPAANMNRRLNQKGEKHLIMASHVIVSTDYEQHLQLAAAAQDAESPRI